MSTIIKHKLLCILWPITPKAVKVALYKKHRKGIENRGSVVVK